MKASELETKINLAKAGKGQDTTKGETVMETTKDEEEKQSEVKGFQQYFNGNIPVQRGMYGSRMVSEGYQNRIEATLQEQLR